MTFGTLVAGVKLDLSDAKSVAEVASKALVALRATQITIVVAFGALDLERRSNRGVIARLSDTSFSVDRVGRVRVRQIVDCSA